MTSAWSQVPSLLLLRHPRVWVPSYGTGWLLELQPSHLQPILQEEERKGDRL